MKKYFQQEKIKFLNLLKDFEDNKDVSVDDILKSQRKLDLLYEIGIKGHKDILNTLVEKKYNFTREVYLKYNKGQQERFNMDNLNIPKEMEEKVVKWGQQIGLASHKIEENIKGTLPHVPDEDMCNNF